MKFKTSRFLATQLIAAASLPLYATGQDAVTPSATSAAGFNSSPSHGQANADQPEGQAANPNISDATGSQANADATGRQGNADARDRQENAGADRQARADDSHRQANPDASSGQEAERIVSGWPERPRLGARMLIAKYGPPKEMTESKLIWRDQGPFRRITVSREEHAHDFPKPHHDFMEHTISYRVPANRADEITRFDGSVTFDRTKGEMSARCDLEEHNVLSLNLAHDIVTGKRDAEEAREQFTEIVVQQASGKQQSEYLTALQFQPPGEGTGNADRPTVPGSAKRATEETAGSAEEGDAQVLGMLVAINENEILASTIAQKKKIGQEVMGYAKMIHEQHGENLSKTLRLGQRIDVTPIVTGEVEGLKVKGAGQLAEIVKLDGPEFEGAYINAMIKGHQEALDLIDNQLLKNAKDETLMRHLQETRGHIAAHLEAAQKLQSTASR